MEKRSLNLMIICLRGLSSRNKNEIKSTFKLIFMQSVTFPDEPAYVMSHDTVPHLFADGYADPVSVPVISTHIQDKVPVRKGFAGAVAFPKIFVLL